MCNKTQSEDTVSKMDIITLFENAYGHKVCADRPPFFSLQFLPAPKDSELSLDYSFDDGFILQLNFLLKTKNRIPENFYLNPHKPLQGKWDQTKNVKEEEKHRTEQIISRIENMIRSSKILNCPVEFPKPLGKYIYNGVNEETVKLELQLFWSDTMTHPEGIYDYLKCMMTIRRWMRQKYQIKDATV